MKIKFLPGRYQVLLFFVALLTTVGLISYVQLGRAPPDAVIGPLQANESDAEAKIELPWPVKGNTAVSIGGVGVVAANRDDRPQPIASLTKLMTAYVVLKDHPLKPGDQGAKLTVGAEDVQLYRQQLNNGESVIPVTAGSEISQYDLLAGLLVPSGNNLAFFLAQWSSGSVESFVDRMNEEAAALGMKNTQYADPSGLSPRSVSTAADQLLLAEAVMSDRILSGIVALKQTQLPGTGPLYNVNSILGQNHIVGVKTGWTEEAGACFVFAADWPVDGQNLRIYGAVLGQDTLADAFAATLRLLPSMGSELRIVTVASESEPSMSLSTAWGEQTTARPKQAVRLIVWPGLQPSVAIEAPSTLASVKLGDEVGQLTVSAGSQRFTVPMVSQGSLRSASLRWRLTRGPSAPW